MIGFVCLAVFWGLSVVFEPRRYSDELRERRKVISIAREP